MGTSREAGFTMVMLVIILALMSIAMGAAVQLVSFQMQREREAELIFRGEQYVEAIRLYKMKFGRNPMSLKEIWEAKPRVVRQKWKDPITDSFAWGLVFVGQEGRQVRDRTAGLGGTPSATPTPTPSPTPAPARGREGEEGEGNQQLGPITGVYSTSCEESIKLYEGRSSYCEWKFIYREQPVRGRSGPGGDTPGNPPGGDEGNDGDNQGDDGGNQGDDGGGKP